MYVDILNNFGVDHECDKQTDRMVFSNSEV